ncbi:unnamed protein product [marine sediment metagenome]|uniref:ArnR1-like winged helix-turn-helix domain-containing protein n=1 Tax=marine sediment metagenome TaxID=412755 RepID=X1CQE6_9ZZZZ
MFERAIRRSRLGLKLSILRACMDGIEKPTRLMNATNMSWTLSQELIKGLVDAGYLELIRLGPNNRSNRRYHITEKGKNVLIYLRKTEDLINF